jgi:acetylornithine deacetylase/succinyl-diaminopimelate desuccinylase-like protein
MASGVWSTKSSTGLEACYQATDIEGVPTRTTLEEIRYLGDTPCDYRENGLKSYFEPHIEQGPKLEAARKKVGVVTAVQGMKWFLVRVSGIERHSETTPMYGRSDALFTAARLITAVSDTAESTSLGVATVGAREIRSHNPQYQARCCVDEQGCEVEYDHCPFKGGH